MEDNKILIIGAGAAGLMAARILAKAGKKVTVLEARNRCGGRIHTLNNEQSFKHAELGAEFVHGDLPVTLNLLKEAGIPFYPAGGEMWHYENGTFNTEGGNMPHWNELMDGLDELKTDITIHDFLQQKFPGEQYAALRKSVEKFAAGYDTADPRKASSFALRKEWQGDDEGAQHRIAGGYAALIAYLASECLAAGGSIQFNSVVKSLNWQNGAVTATTSEGATYEAVKALIALPLGVLQANDDAPAAIAFTPPIPDKINAINNLGFGAIIKIILEFTDAFWEDEFTTSLSGKSTQNMGFILSDEEIPTWWTQVPQHNAVLTGWLGGPAATAQKHTQDDDLLQSSINALAIIFKRDEQYLREKLIASKVMNWTNDPYTLGSYAYDTVAAQAARKTLSVPVGGTLFFAGEYLYEGTAMGTVEAALTSGKDAAEQMAG